MGKKNDERQMKFAAYMKANNIVRKTGSCPMGCGAQIANGGPALINHLGRCNGK